MQLITYVEVKYTKDTILITEGDRVLTVLLNKKVVKSGKNIMILLPTEGFAEFAKLNRKVWAVIPGDIRGCRDIASIMEALLPIVSFIYGWETRDSTLTNAFEKITRKEAMQLIKGLINVKQRSMYDLFSPSSVGEV